MQCPAIGLKVIRPPADLRRTENETPSTKTPFSLRPPAMATFTRIPLLHTLDPRDERGSNQGPRHGYGEGDGITPGNAHD